MTTNATEQLIARLVMFTDNWMIGRGYTFSARDGVADLYDYWTRDDIVPTDSQFADYNNGLTWLIATEVQVRPESTGWPLMLRGLLAAMDDLAANAND